MKPNILLITVDQMRGDCLGIQGHPVVETPYLDTMAREGALFSSAFTAVPSCIASRASIMTGLSQGSHGRVGYQDGVAWNYEHTLAGEFAKGGYHTQAVGKMHVHPLRNLCGFHNVVLHDGYLHYYRGSKVRYGENQKAVDDYMHWLKDKAGMDADIIDTGLDCNSWVARPWIYPEQYHPTNWVVTESIDFLRRRDPSKPFFLMSSFVRPHSPLDPPQTYYDMYIDREIPDPPAGEWADQEDTDRQGRNINCARGNVDPKALKRARAAYYGCITHIDHQIGRLLQALHDYDVLNNTIILFTSDHGDLLGDHHLYRKSLPYRGSISVPFIVYDPGNLLGLRKGAVIDEVVELRDIMPSLLDFAGIKVPETVEGSSILPLLRGEEADWREYLHGEHSFGNNSNHFIVTRNDKYIWYSQDGREQYFRIDQDPDELHDLSQDPAAADRMAFLRQCLIKELEGREEGYSDGSNLIIGRPPQSVLLPFCHPFTEPK